MQINELVVNERFLFEHVPCRKIDAGEIISSVGQIKLYGTDDFLFRCRDNTFTFTITDKEIAEKIRDNVRRKFIGVVYVESTAKAEDGKYFFSLRIIFFMSLVRFGRFQIIIGNKVKATLRKHGYNADDYQSLQQNFTFNDGISVENCFAFFSAIPPEESEEEISADDKENMSDETPVEIGQIEKTEPPEKVEQPEEEEFAENVEESEPLPAANEKVLQIKGNGFRLLVKLEGEGADSRAIAYRAILDKNSNDNEKLILQLAYGVIEFSDEKSFIAARVKDILQSTPNYITIWNEYAMREGDFLLAKSRSVGKITYLPRFNQTEKGLEITIADKNTCNLSTLSVGDRVELRRDSTQSEDSMPPYIADTEMTWQGYQDWKIKMLEVLNAPDENGRKPLKKKHLPSHESFEISAVGENILTLKNCNVEDLPENGNLFLSIYGDEKQIERRREARQRIENGTSASPNLRLILGSRQEDSSQSLGLTSENRKHIEPRSNLLREKIFSYEPTVNQIQAIDIALNTPDIAVIQGPPGTGKTTVITAILERLNELSDKNNLQAGQVLVTSLQHDAVQNVIERIEINSLPTIKFGKRQSDDNQNFETSVKNWCAKVLQALEEKHPQLKRTDKEQKLFNLFNLYTSFPTNAKALNFLQAARQEIHDDYLISKIDKILEEIEPSRNSSDKNLIAKIYRLPTTPESFQDNGQDVLIDLLNELEILLGDNSSEILNVLKDAALNDSPDEETFSSLKNLRVQLLQKFIQPPTFDTNEAREDIIEVYQAVKNALHRPENEIDNAIYEFYRSLKDNPFESQDAIKSYSFAFAATAQQSDGKEIKRAKNLENPNDENSHAEYDTVIVDEAARITPGDLMIPLSQASRRIILVGDQRQLPHIYDEEIFEALRKEGKILDFADIKEPMFQHLWRKAHELEKSDGIKRTVTLDAQYRTHPTLGQFVSDNFYKPYGEAFTSPRPASDFMQNIYPFPVCWINIPENRGKHFRTSSRSLRRDCEVDYIAETLQKYIDDPVNEKLSFGVISFYRAQAQAIKSRIKNFGSRVRIGTVDEFQGMEFDVIFLSVVRSGGKFEEVDLDYLENPPPEDSENFADYDEYKQKILSGNYGFLNDNRLCVALSRQKKLLIVVGDAGLFNSEKSARTAKICVPAMFNLYNLCQSLGGVING